MRGIKKEKTPFVRVKSDKQETDLMVSNVDLLKQIADNTNKGNQLLSQLRTFFKKSDKKDLKVDKPFQYANKKLGLSVKKNKIEENIVSIADNIQETVDLFYETLEDTKDIKRKTGSNTGTGSQSYTVRRGKSLLYDSYNIWREKALLE